MSPKNTTSVSTEDVCEFLGYLSRRRQVFRSLSTMQLKAFITDAQGVLSDRLDDEKRAQHQEEEKKERIKQHLELLKKDGITPNDISPYLRKKKPSIGPVKKYLINGETVTYKGAGRMPAKLKALTEKVGKKGLEDYEVKSTN